MLLLICQICKVKHISCNVQISWSLCWNGLVLSSRIVEPKIWLKAMERSPPLMMPIQYHCRDMNSQNGALSQPCCLRWCYLCGETRTKASIKLPSLTVRLGLVSNKTKQKSCPQMVWSFLTVREKVRFMFVLFVCF